MPIGLTAFAASLWAGAPNGTTTNYDGSTTRTETAMPGSGTAQPPGLEATLEYNGLLMHDRTVSDKYRVMEIDGLHGSDVRDNREANPSDHGETAFDSYLGGRTIVITGRVEGHNVQKLRDMQQSLRTSFTSFQERPLIFHTGNSNRDVQIYAKMIDKISMVEKQANLNPWRDFQITLRASDPRFRSVVDRIANQSYGVLDTFTKPVAVLSTNIIPNPVMGTMATTGYGGLNSTLTTVAGPGNANRLRSTCNSTAGGNGIYNAGIPVVAGTTYTFSVNVTALPTGKNYYLVVEWKNAGGTTFAFSTSVNFTTAGRKSITDTAPATAVSGTMTCYSSAVGVVGDVLDTTEWMACNYVPGLPAFFAGDTYRARWVGIPHASSSEYLADDYIAGSNFEQLNTNTPGSFWFDGSQMRVLQNGGNVILRRNDIMPSTDLRNTVKVTTPPVLGLEGGGGPGLWIKGVDTTNFIYARLAIVNGTQARIDLLKVVNNSLNFLLVGAVFTVTASTTYYLRTTIVGNAITGQLFSSDPNSGGTAVAGSLSSFTLTGSDATQFGSGIAGYTGFFINTQIGNYPIDDLRSEPLAMNTNIVVNNAGNFLALPKIRLYGPMMSPVITNTTVMPDETAARFVKINGSIPAGRYYEYDAQKGTLFDDLGSNQFAKYDISSKQIQYAPGQNNVSVAATGLSDITPQIISTHQDTWV